MIILDTNIISELMRPGLMTPDTPDRPSAPNGDFIHRLPTEVARWRADGLISEEQATALLERYDSDAAESAGGAIGNRVVTATAVMGASLIGLGIIAFIAANWSGIPALAKLALMVIGTPAIYIIGWFAGYRFDYPRIGVAIILLGAIAFGASIHLIAQAYHVPYKSSHSGAAVVPGRHSAGVHHSFTGVAGLCRSSCSWLRRGSVRRNGCRPWAMKRSYSRFRHSSR